MSACLGCVFISEISCKMYNRNLNRKYLNTTKMITTQEGQFNVRIRKGLWGIMAKIFPEDLSYYSLTGSEELMIDALRKQLSDDYIVFYSIRWNDEGEDSECDLLIFHENFGFICLEVKGGKSIGAHMGQYYIELDDNERRYLKCSPHSQAEKSMRHFLRSFKETYNKKF